MRFIAAEEWKCGMAAKESAITQRPRKTNHFVKNDPAKETRGDLLKEIQWRLQLAWCFQGTYSIYQILESFVEWKITILKSTVYRHIFLANKSGHFPTDANPFKTFIHCLITHAANKTNPSKVLLTAKKSLKDNIFLPKTCFLLSVVNMSNLQTLHVKHTQWKRVNRSVGACSREGRCGPNCDAMTLHRRIKPTAPFSSEKRNSTEDLWEDRGWRERKWCWYCPLPQKRQLSTWAEFPVVVEAGFLISGVRTVQSLGTYTYMVTLKWSKLSPGMKTKTGIGHQIDKLCVAILFRFGLHSTSLGWVSGLALGKPNQH